MYEITRFKNGYLNIHNGEVLRFETFKELAEHISTLDTTSTSKDGSYWCRGRLAPAIRYNHNMERSSLIVIDGDKGEQGGCPPLDKLHSAMVVAGLSHCIYSSHSHIPGERNKFRLIIPTREPMEATELKAQTRAVIGMLQAMGMDVAHVKEDDTWSQPWFYPRTENPEYFEKYIHTDGKTWKLVQGLREEPEIPLGDGSGKTLDEHMQALVTGSEYHSSILALSMGMCRDGVPRATITALLRNLVALSPPSERRNKRLADIDRLVVGGIKRAQEEALGQTKFSLPAMEQEQYAIPLPPGQFGNLVQQTWETMHYRCYPVALIANMGLLSGIMGRRYNVHGTGLNLYFLLAMYTGSGKDFLSNYISSMLLRISSSSDMYSFMARKRYTGPKALYQQLQDARCCISVMSELGLMLSSGSGDSAGLRRYMLDIYGKSGAGQVYIGEGYSDNTNNIGTLHSPALSVIGESTPDNLIKSLLNSDSISDGFLPRNFIVRIEDDQPYMTINPRREISPDHISRIGAIAKDCAQIQSVDLPEIYEIGFAPDIAGDVQQYSMDCVDRVNAYRKEDLLKSAMASRQWLKAVKIAALASAYNNDNLQIGKAEWDWARDLVDWEYGKITSFLHGSDTSSVAVLAEDVMKKIANELVRLLKSKTRSKAESVQTKHAEIKFIPLSVARRTLSRRPAIMAMSDDLRFTKQPKTGFVKAMVMMTAAGYVKFYDKAPAGEPVEEYQLTNKILKLFN